MIFKLKNQFKKVNLNELIALYLKHHKLFACAKKMQL